MPRVFRQQYTRPIPDGAERVTHKGQPAVRFKGSDGKYVVAPLTKKGDRCRVASPVWYGHVPDPDAPGESNRVPLCENKTAAEIMLADLMRKAELGKAGVRDPFEKHRRRPLREHLEDWQAALLAGGATAKHVAQTTAGVRRLLDGCGFAVMADLSASRVQEHLAALRACGKALAPLDPAKEWYTRRELLQALQVKGNVVQD